MESPSYSTSTYFSTGTLADPFIVLPVGHPQNPSNEDLGLRYRFMDVLHYTRVQSDLQRLVFGVRGTVAGWDGETALMSARSNTKVHTTGLINDSVLLNEVLDANGNALNTFTFGNPSANDPGLMSRLYPDLKDVGKTATTSIDLRASRDLMQMPAGPLGFAFGLEVRHESFNTKPDPLTESGAISVLGGSSSDGSRNVSAAYAEFSVPVFKTLEASLAARVDHYSDFGSATTPKVGLKWKALPTLVLRGTYAEGFRAPALTELTQSPSRGFYSIRDPKLCPDPSDTTNTNCDLSVLAISGSNPKLQPEKSKNMTVGLVFEPTRNLSFTADYYRIKRRDEISSIDPDYLLANEGMFPGYVVRDPNTSVIQQLNLQYTNLGSTRVEGYDIEGKGTFDVGALGKLSLNATYNRTPHYWVANVKGAQELDYAGTYLQPKERMQFGFDLEHGPYSGGLTWNYIGSYLRAYTPTDLSCPYSNGAHPELCGVKSWLTADLFLRWVPIKNLELNLTMTNIENKQAPVDERMATRYTLFTSTYHDQVGRFTKLTARYTFW
jgi:iron complex outermembrane receptor protein